jgi:hypothetical protein
MSNFLERASETLKEQWDKFSAYRATSQVLFEPGDEVFIKDNPERIGTIDEVVTRGERNPITMQWINAPNYSVKFDDSQTPALVGGSRLVDAAALQNPQINAQLNNSMP